MSSPGQKRGTCGHLKCARCRDKGVRDDPCVLKKECPICKAFTPEQLQQLATPTYRDRKNREKMLSASPVPATPTLVDSSQVSVLGRVEGEKFVKKKTDTTPAGKKRRPEESGQQQDDKWAERFARLEAMIFAKSFAVPVEPVVKSTEVITSDKPFLTLGPVPARPLPVGSQMLVLLVPTLSRKTC